MHKLLKNEFFTILKNKSFYINLMIYIAISIFTTLVYGIIKLTADSSIPLVLTFETVFPTFFGFSNSIYALIITIIFINSRDYSLGTIRNKITAGYTRNQIYFSKLISIFTVSLGFFLSALLVNVALGGAMLGFDGMVLVDTLKMLLMGMLLIIFAIVLVFLISLSFKSPGASIGVSLGIFIGFTLISTVVLTLSSITIPGETAIIDPEGPLIQVLKFIPFFQNATITGGLMGMGGISSVPTPDFLIYTLSSTVFIVGFIVLGLFKFRRMDMK